MPQSCYTKQNKPTNAKKEEYVIKITTTTTNNGGEEEGGIPRESYVCDERDVIFLSLSLSLFALLSSTSLSPI